jgi:diguanylate cyclase (GGDEF)-like protein
MKAVHNGAADYLVKGHTNTHFLSRAIQYALERRQAEAESADEAMYDPLTGLPNRNLFVKRLRHALKQCSDSHSSVAVFFVQLDNLELINDNLGQPVGKRLLQAVSMRLRAGLPEVSGIACFDSGLFGLLRENISSGPYRGRTIDRVLKSLDVPFVLDTETIFVSAQIGVAVSESGIDDDPESLIRRAKTAAAHEAADEGNPHCYTALPAPPPFVARKAC